MLSQKLPSPPSSEIDYICIAANLLHRMMSELQCLESNNSRLTLAMATAGHDLRQRLHTLIGTVELLTLADDPALAARLSGNAKTLIQRLATDLERLAADATKDHKRSMPQTHCFNISSVLEQIHLDWVQEADAKRLLFEVAQTEAIVESEKRLLTVILNNVVANALRYTARGEVRLDSFVDDQNLVLSVRDTGPGISDTDLLRSYEGTPRVGELGSGLGIGLSIARRTADALGHEFIITTAPNEGTCVRVQVPLARPSLVSPPDSLN